MAKSPAYQWYPKDILSSARVAEMDLIEECAYRRALDFCWLNLTLPADPLKLSRIIGKGCTEQVATVVAAMFIICPSDPSRLCHERLDQEREKQAEWARKSSQAGKKSAELRAERARLELEESNQRSTNLETLVEPNSNQIDNQPINQNPTLQSASSITSTNTQNTRESGANAPSRSIEERKAAFEKSLAGYVATYPKTMVRAFSDYWTEKNQSGKKMRFELEKTWETARRISTWAAREKIQPNQQTNKPQTGPDGMTDKDRQLIFG